MSQNCNDKNELAAGVAAILEELGSPEAVLVDNGHANGAEVEKVEAYVSTGAEGRRRLHDFRPPKDKPEKDLKADWLRKMTEKLQTDEGKLLYALRKQTVEPVFGVIKSALGIRMFSLRGIELVRGEWNLVTLAYDCKRIHTDRLAGQH